jgi:membrane protease YdiL (CAAX protease family)
MKNAMRSKTYWARLIPALCWHALYLVLCGGFDRYDRVYFDLMFFLVLVVYFAVWRCWRFSEWKDEVKSGKAFWFPVIFTVLGMAAMFGVSIGLAAVFPDVDTKMAVLGVSDWPSLIAFTFTTILLPPVAEEAFYRQSVTAFDSKTILAVTTVVSILLYASEHSLAPLGLLTACLWAIPLNIAYIKTRNVYVCMTAHFFCNLVVNGITVVGVAVSLAN